MFDTKSSTRIAAIAACASLACALPARADSPFSLQVGPQFGLQSSGRSAAGNVATDVGLNYDFGPRTVIPIRASLQFENVNGTNGAFGNLHQNAFGVAGRLTTPLYAGFGVSVYTTSAAVSNPFGFQYHSTSIGTNYFVGQRVLALPGGTAFSLQATYQQIPAFAGIDTSALGAGVRVQF